ncbi:MAG: acyl-CoA thioesterase [Pseudomonadota bacterium]
MDGQSVSFSRTTMTELMIPAYANFGGKIHGGHLLSLMDKVAYACASRHAGTYCVTVSVDTVHFLKPVEVGELVSFQASVNYVGNSSLVVGMRVTSENVQSRVVNHTNTSYFTMVARSETGGKVQVPPLILETTDDVRRFFAALKRRELSQRNRETMKAYDHSDFRLSGEAGAALADERCIIHLLDESSDMGS